MGQSLGKTCLFGEGLYTLWLCMDLLVMFCQSGTPSHPQSINNATPTSYILDVHMSYLRNPAPEEDNSDDTPHHHHPGSVLAQVSQYNPSPLVFVSPVQSGFLPPKQATMDCNQSRTDPDIVGTEPDHL